MTLDIVNASDVPADAVPVSSPVASPIDPRVVLPENFQSTHQHLPLELLTPFTVEQQSSILDLYHRRWVAAPPIKNVNSNSKVVKSDANEQEINLFRKAVVDTEKAMQQGPPEFSIIGEAARLFSTLSPEHQQVAKAHSLKAARAELQAGKTIKNTCKFYSVRIYLWFEHEYGRNFSTPPFELSPAYQISFNTLSRAEQGAAKLYCVTEARRCKSTIREPANYYDILFQKHLVYANYNNSKSIGISSALARSTAIKAPVQRSKSTSSAIKSAFASTSAENCWTKPLVAPSSPDKTSVVGINLNDGAASPLSAPSNVTLTAESSSMTPREEQLQLALDEALAEIKQLRQQMATVQQEQSTTIRTMMESLTQVSRGLRSENSNNETNATSSIIAPLPLRTPVSSKAVAKHLNAAFLQTSPALDGDSCASSHFSCTSFLDDVNNASTNGKNSNDRVREAEVQDLALSFLQSNDFLRNNKCNPSPSVAFSRSLSSSPVSFPPGFAKPEPTTELNSFAASWAPAY